MFRINQFL